ncbi:M15 family metallopeptidase [Leptolyngbya sp. 'hensonii']|uniref:M15 family metallopeptidase n=1 Tax=Leptolyngbya sp. 'hensonii' TaxID=1922337 RepID=UPI000B15E2E3|nr:M15 family metallopeptidase [Leptolyngbya sp. 'hensonii']
MSASDDIPVAIREGETRSSKVRLKQGPLLLVLAGVATIALLNGIWFAYQSVGRQSTDTANQQPGSDRPTNRPGTETSKNTDTLLGHYAYQEAPLQDLRPIVADGSIKLRRSAAAKFQAMVSAARTDGVSLMPISGFRTLADQQYLFFDVKAERNQSAQKRAEVSAPPGYSEHHTGYAVDIGDGNVPAADLNPVFENTAAFQWLKAHAAQFQFELSFPKNNSQGVSYEPWHWRFVGDQSSLETFYKARSSQ